MAAEQAAALVGVLNKVIRYAVGVGVGVSALQTSLYTGMCVCVCVRGALFCGAFAFVLSCKGQALGCTPMLSLSL